MTVSFLTLLSIDIVYIPHGGTSMEPILSLSKEFKGEELIGEP